MSRETQALVEAFDHLPAEEKRIFIGEVLRRSLPFDSGPLEDEEIGTTSAALLAILDEGDSYRHMKPGSSGATSVAAGLPTTLGRH